MKECIVEIPLFMTPYNMEYLLNGVKIINYEKLYSCWVNSKDLFIYNYNDLYTDSSIHPPIVGTIIGCNIDDPQNPKLRVSIIDTLYYSKLSDPVIRCNGKCIQSHNTIEIVDINRYTLSERSSTAMY